MNNLGEAGHFLAKTFKVWQTLKVLIDVKHHASFPENDHVIPRNPILGKNRISFLVQTDTIPKKG